jgi:pyridoxine 5-phosphate synthase
MTNSLRLGVNIDHVATIRNARGGFGPDPVRAALLAQTSGADGITAHLREDRRHIRDEDIEALIEALKIPLNFEMASTSEMQEIALRFLPNAVCIVPEKRQERTTEGGLEVEKDQRRLADFIQPLSKAGCRVSLFVEPDERQIEASKEVGASVVELHTGAYCNYQAEGKSGSMQAELARIARCSTFAQELGLEVHAGHGLTFDNVSSIAALPEILELNIGHFLIGESVFTGLETAISDMRRLMIEARR